jgi:hypothetical protein
MGTSASSRGTPNAAPLVPPWADPQNQYAKVQVDPQRAKAFRTSLGRFAADSDRDELHRGLGHYARTSTGGHTAGAGRFSSMARAGGALFDTLNALRRNTKPTEVSLDLGTLRGADTDVAIQAIVQALTPPDGDAEKIQNAMHIALAESLQGIDTFDFKSISDDVLVATLVAYTRECVFLQVITDSSRAFQRAPTIQAAEFAEKELHTLVSVVVDAKLRPLFASGVKALTRSQVESIQLAAVADVWREWESFE